MQLEYIQLKHTFIQQTVTPHLQEAGIIPGTGDGGNKSPCLKTSF